MYIFFGETERERESESEKNKDAFQQEALSIEKRI